jgi:hypothetical protein
MAYVLVTFEMDWADEFSVYGFRVMEREEWNKLKEAISTCESFEWQFGTNEGWEDEDGSDFIRGYSVKDLTDTEAELFKTKLAPKNYLGNYQFGIFPDMSFVNDD